MADTVDEFLEHHGVKGMKWGVRKDRNKALGTSNLRINDRKQKDFVAIDLEEDRRKSYDPPINKSSVRQGRKTANRIVKAVDNLKKEMFSKVSFNDLLEDVESRYFGKDMNDPKMLEKFYKEVESEFTSVARSFNKSDYEVNVFFDDNKDELIVALGTPGYYKELYHEDKEILAFSIPVKKNSDGLIMGFGKPYSGTMELKHSDEFDDFLAHYGVKGMKWGIRKNRAGKRKSTTQVLAEEKRRSRKSNSLSSNPQNKRMTDSEMSSLIRRIEMEQRLSNLTAPQKAPPSRLKNMMKDVAFDVTKGALTEVGKLALSQALKINYNKVASQEYKILIKKIQEATDK